MAYESNNRPRKSNFKKMTIELVSLDRDDFDCEDLIRILRKIPFNRININLSTTKENVGLNGRGFTPIGFVNKFYTEEDESKCVFDVAIIARYAEHIEALQEDYDLGITARVFKDKEGNITKIIGLDLTPVQRERD